MDLPSIISTINRSPNKSTKATPHRLLFSIDLCQPWQLLKQFIKQDFSVRLDAEESMKYASIRMKEIYDQNHKPIEFRVGDQVYVRLHHGYSLPTKQVNHKLQLQNTGPFRVLERVGRLAYHIKLPSTWKIHPVLSVAHLEPAPATPDPFHHELPKPPAVVNAKVYPGEDDIYKVKCLLDKHTIQRGRKHTPYVEYLVR